MQYWSAADILNQVSGELGISKADSDISTSTVQSVQLLAALNSAGNELLTYYPWAQFVKEWAFTTVADQEVYPVPGDWKYFRDQTQWDRTNHWPLMGPKSPAEWAYIKGSLVAPLPRMRFRVVGNNFLIYPKPPVTGFVPYNLAMEYISGNWIAAGADSKSMVVQGSDIVQYDPWLIIKFTKLKFYQLKQFDTTAVEKDFMRIFQALTGKDTGAQVYSLSPRPNPQFIGLWSIPDGNWNQ